MAELENVAKWLERCTNGDAHCRNCPYDDHVACKTFLMRDALKLINAYKELQERHKFLVEKCDDMFSTLKEKNKEIETLELQNAYLETEMLNEEPKIIRCRDCKHYRPHRLFECEKHGSCQPNPDWYCADGEVK